MVNPFEEIKEEMSQLVNDTKSEILSRIEELKPKPSEPAFEKYRSAAHVMDRFDIKRTTVWQWEKKGILKPVFIDGTKRYLESDLQKMGSKRGAYKGSELE